MQTLKTPLSHHLHHSQRSHHHQQLHYWEEMCFAGSNNIKEALVSSQLLTIVEKTTAEQSCFAFANELSHNLLEEEAFLLRIALAGMDLLLMLFLSL